MDKEVLLLLRGGCFPGLGVFGCCCSVGCEAVGRQRLSPGLCFRLEEVVALAVDLITQSRVVSLMVSLPMLPEPLLRALQSPPSHLGLDCFHSRWDGSRHSLAVPALGRGMGGHH